MKIVQAAELAMQNKNQFADSSALLGIEVNVAGFTKRKEHHKKASKAGNQQSCICWKGTSYHALNFPHRRPMLQQK